MHFNDDRIESAPLPTPKTLRQRKSVFFQFFRFLVLNVKILEMVHKAHD